MTKSLLMTRERVNIDQCKALGSVLQKLNPKQSAYEREFITFEVDRETKLRAYLFCVAICHQTHTLDLLRNLSNVPVPD